MHILSVCCLSVCSFLYVFLSTINGEKKINCLSHLCSTSISVRFNFLNNKLALSLWILGLLSIDYVCQFYAITAGDGATCPVVQ